MTAVQRDRRFYILLSLLFLVLGSNTLLYRSPLTPIVLPTDANWVVVGSLIDFAIVAPLLILYLKRGKKITVKSFITWMVAGLVFARFLIPSAYFESFTYVPIAAIGIEALLVLAELALVALLAWRLPGIIRWIKSQGESPLFSLTPAVEKSVGNHMLLQVLASEFLMFYYAFASWKKQPPSGGAYFSLHKNSSLIAFYVMLIHAIVIETAAVHWMIHEMSVVFSVITLLLNIYTVIFFIGDIQSIRLNPLFVQREKIFVSLGLGKRIIIPMEAIKDIKWGKEAEEEKINQKETITFIAKDFETLPPHCIIEFKKPLTANFFMGFKKTYTKAAIRLDEPDRFRSLIDKEQ
ncbi:beta-carotene 15,15'-monooxygenase [Siminovitchia acidinfaciens]|uniref:Beta-carotene 15,15'-monooxygenase n=1 Tax=Siminovitchia acidinfaciens TaxID=2321395 RepID=A0A429Y808_9BACI|nr:beta-carotene 15,15'-monooxygenase [Siminovitchia acidinfaciens]RST77542.1 beta-carotene 15,15'-monooxygenase [Siminovitchia acidinfaciens]